MAEAPARIATGLLAGALLSACAVGNQAGDLQVPALVAGLVTASVPCPAGAAACPGVVAVVPGALVEAIGKDGTHDALADANGHYQLSLEAGQWTFVARRSRTSTAAGAPRQVRVDAGSNAIVNLQAGT